MKALNNLVSAGGFLIGVEAMLIGQQFGLDPNVIVDVLNASTGMNNSTQKKFKQFVLSREFNSGFGLDLMVKDLGIALGIATDTGTPTPFASLCRELWASAGKTLGKGQDHTAVARLSEQLAAWSWAQRKRIPRFHPTARHGPRFFFKPASPTTAGTRRRGRLSPAHTARSET
ncbi:2-(hydroxymethyl)glutarate dehydrogenase [compost metagenome]